MAVVSNDHSKALTLLKFFFYLFVGYCNYTTAGHNGETKSIQRLEVESTLNQRCFNVTS